jgi:hypothetical protein
LHSLRRLAKSAQEGPAHPLAIGKPATMAA